MSMEESGGGHVPVSSICKAADRTQNHDHNAKCAGVRRCTFRVGRDDSAGERRRLGQISFHPLSCFPSGASSNRCDSDRNAHALAACGQADANSRIRERVHTCLFLIVYGVFSTFPRKFDSLKSKNAFLGSSKRYAGRSLL